MLIKVIAVNIHSKSLSLVPCTTNISACTLSFKSSLRKPTLGIIVKLNILVPSHILNVAGSNNADSLNSVQYRTMIQVFNIC